MQPIEPLFRLTSITPWIALGAGILVIGGATGGLWYEYTQIASLSTRVDSLSAEFASTTASIQGSLADATTSLSHALIQESQSVNAVQTQLQNQVGSITGTVNDLQKLSQTDPELLAKYSKVFFLSENYVPADLVKIPLEYKYTESKDLELIPQVLPRLEDMIDQAGRDGVSIYVDSAYRSFGTQESLKSQYNVTYGAGTANQFSADQGYSEHQLGTAVDLITTGTGGALDGFDKTPAYSWLQKNAYRYGFILSYPPGNSYYVFEPWHWRFVGVKLATYLHGAGKNFYDLDQRTIDDYLVSIFD